MTLDLNDGTRPSLLAVDLHLTGEDVSEEAAQWLTTAPGRAHQEAVQTAKNKMGSFDAAALRARAAKTPAAPPVPQAANNTRYYLAALLAAAAVLGMLFLPTTNPSPSTDPTYIGVRGTSLDVFHLDDSTLRPYDRRVLGEGDVLGFKVDPGAHNTAALLSVDGEGNVSVYYEGEPVNGPGALPGTIVLDDAKGPEVFVAVFGSTVSEARAEAQRAWQAGGTPGVMEWAAANGTLDATVVERR